MNKTDKLIKPSSVKFQRQPDKLTCFAAVTAMLIGKYVEDVISELEERDIKPPYNNSEMIPYLVRNNIFIEKINSSIMPLMLSDIIYIGIINNGVASGNLHSVLFHINDGYDATILDPGKDEPYFKKAPLLFETIYSVYDCN